MAGKASRARAATARGRAIGMEHGLGEHLRAWDGTHLKSRAGCGSVLIVIATGGGIIPAVVAVLRPGMSGQEPWYLGWTIGFLLIGLPMLASPRHNVQWLHQYEAGLAEVTSGGPVTVLRWADLASLTSSICHGSEDQFNYPDSYTLRDIAGHVITVGTSPGQYSRRFARHELDPLLDQAERVLADRLAVPLISRLDEGLPVIVGPITVDPAGIRYDDRYASWWQVRSVSTQFRGTQVTVQGQDRWWFDLEGANDFIAKYVLAHAARLAGVPRVDCR